MDFHLNMKYIIRAAATMTCFLSRRHSWHLKLTVTSSSLLGGFDVSRQADVSLHQISVKVPTGCLLSQPGLLKPLRGAPHPERHQCLGVHNNVTQTLPQPFVSASLALRELSSISWSKPGTPAAHPSRVLSPADGPLPCLFPRLLFSSALCCHCAIQSSPFACCNYPLHRRPSPGTPVDIFSPLCSGTKGNGCDGQQPMKCSFKCSLPAEFCHHV